VGATAASDFSFSARLRRSAERRRRGGRGRVVGSGRAWRLGVRRSPFPPGPVDRQRVRRIALYSHDTQGLGHIRRNSLIGACLAMDHPDTNLLLLTGVPEALALPLPPRTDLVTVPALAKDSTGGYGARTMEAPLAEVLAIREAVFAAALSSFAPDLLIVDKVPLGVDGELGRALRQVRDAHGTRMVLGLRDVLDDRETTSLEWRKSRAYDAIAALYDEVWVYGDRAVFDPAVEYGWPPEVTEKVRYTGYLGCRRAELLTAPADGCSTIAAGAAAPFVLGLVGGGQDGAELATAFARAAYPAGCVGVLITGPYLDPAVFSELAGSAAGRNDLLVLRFVADVPQFANRSSATITMGGYNSVCEALAGGCPTLVVPRTVPRREQAIRADHMSAAGLVDVLDQEEATPARLGEWLAAAVSSHPPRGRSVDLDGLSEIPRLAARLMGELHGAPEGAFARVVV
jgi:predicted glycosyltransferase